MMANAASRPKCAKCERTAGLVLLILKGEKIQITFHSVLNRITKHKITKRFGAVNHKRCDPTSQSSFVRWRVGNNTSNLTEHHSWFIHHHSLLGNIFAFHSLEVKSNEVKECHNDFWASSNAFRFNQNMIHPYCHRVATQRGRETRMTQSSLASSACPVTSREVVTSIQTKPAEKSNCIWVSSHLYVVSISL